MGSGDVTTNSHVCWDSRFLVPILNVCVMITDVVAVIIDNSCYILLALKYTSNFTVKSSISNK